MFRSSTKSLRDGLLSLAYPSECRLCGSSIESWDHGPVCSACWADPEITPLFENQPICVKCGFPLRSFSSSNHDLQASTPPVSAPPVSGALERQKCGACQESPLYALRSVGLYHGTLESSVLFLKSNPHICPFLFNLMGRTCRGSASHLASDLIVPIPLHASRKRERGFNQATVIARAVSRIFGVPVNESLLQRTKRTERHRAGMDSFDRAKSIAGAFSAGDTGKVAGMRVLLVDDLCTTGSTLAEAATALINAGAGPVSAFTIARAAVPK